MITAHIIQITSTLDFDPAFQHAQNIAEVLPKGDISHFTEDRVYRELSDRLRLFKEQDFLILSGDPELIALTFLVLSKRFSVIRLLKYDRFTHTYKIRKHSIS